MSKGDIVCKRCGADASNGLETGGVYYCSKFCMLEDNPDLVKKSKSAQDWLKEARRREVVKAKMRELKKEAAEVGLPWI